MIAMKNYYFRFKTKALMDSLIQGNPDQYPVGTFGVDLETGKVYVAAPVAAEWTLVGAQI